MSAEGLDRCDLEHAGQLVAGHDWALVNEALVAVHNTAEVNVDIWVSEHGTKRVLLNEHCKGWRGNDVGVAGCLGCKNVKVEGIDRLHCLGELANLLAADQVRLGGRVLLALGLGVYHSISLTARRGERRYRLMSLFGRLW